MLKKDRQKKIYLGAGLLILFAMWTVLVQVADVQAIGPRGSAVGLATFNGLVHKLTGVHMTLYVITDWLGLVPVCFVMGFGIFGILQWIRRKSFFRVDSSILALGGLYLLTMAAYMFFEEVVINYRPILINGFLEASYPSSTTLLVLCVMPTAMMQFRCRIRQKLIRQSVQVLIMAFIIFMVLGRLISGVHWFSDIIGGILLSGGLVTLYDAFSKRSVD